MGKIDRIQADVDSGLSVQELYSLGTLSGPVLCDEFSLVPPEDVDKTVGEVRLPVSTLAHHG